MKSSNAWRQRRICSAEFIWILSLSLVFGCTWSTGQVSLSKTLLNHANDARPLAFAGTYPVVDTGQNRCYDDFSEIPCPLSEQPFWGQDAQYQGCGPRFTDHGDGTISDDVTGLMWQKTPSDEKVTFDEAVQGASRFDLAGNSDWRLPTIKELYSLIDFRGVTGGSAAQSIPYIDIAYFDFAYGDTASGERFIDAQYWSSTEYVGTTMGGSATTFGVNFADGRIKGYGRERPGGEEMRQYVRYVRGNLDYGQNNFEWRNDGTILDRATGLMWMSEDSGHLGAGTQADGAMTWEEALAWAEDLEYAGFDDWRLPNAKELQSIVDYTRSPATHGSPALDPLFEATPITDEGGNLNYGFYWTGTTHLDGLFPGQYAVYIAFGEALGFMEIPPGSGQLQLLDVHGAGAQRSDPKSGDPNDYPFGHGPQGDVIRIDNLVRCVRDARELVPTPCTTQLDPPICHMGAEGGSSSISIHTPASCSWNAFTDANWLHISPSSGIGPTTCTVAVDPTESSRSGKIMIGHAVLDVTQSSSPASSASGAILFAPLNSNETFLINSEGEILHTWQSEYRPGHSAYLLDPTRVLRCGDTADTHFNAGGAGGLVEQIGPESQIEWSFHFSDESHRLHHDIEPLPNGHVLMLAWEYRSESEALAAGRRPGLLRDRELWADTVIEVRPTGPTSGEIVWEWHVWDHLIQDFDATQFNYGVVADHPELVDINYSTGSPSGVADWTHINAIDYHADLDQILLSVRNFSEIWIIDHSTSTEDAASHQGGQAGRGGDLLYRWGNPQAYDRGDANDQTLFVQHDAQWISDGIPGAGNILVFNNGQGRPGGNYSSVDEFAPPKDGFGGYVLYPDQAYGPDHLEWRFAASNPRDFFASHISGAQRLQDGQTLICDGPAGRLFQVTADGELTWEYNVNASVFRARHYALEP